MSSVFCLAGVQREQATLIRERVGGTGADHLESLGVEETERPSKTGSSGREEASGTLGPGILEGPVSSHWRRRLKLSR